MTITLMNLAAKFSVKYFQTEFISTLHKFIYYKQTASRDPRMTQHMQINRWDRVHKQIQEQKKSQGHLDNCRKGL